MAAKAWSTLIAAELAVVIALALMWGYRKLLAPQSPSATALAEVRTKPPADPPPVAPPSEPPARSWKTLPPAPVTQYDHHALPPLSRPSLLIEKSKRRLTVFDDGRPVKRYRAAVGGAAGDKVRKGDHRTPEGVFYVCQKNPHSDYTVSLGLSYPNVEDARRGLRDGLIHRADYGHILSEIQRGRQPPWGTALGGWIMIHGKRNSGRGTEGCIALEDVDIRELYPRIRLGTKVTIVP